MHPLIEAIMEADTAYRPNFDKPIKHGTRGGAKAHRRRGEAPCPPCAAEDAMYSRKYKRAVTAAARARRAATR